MKNLFLVSLVLTQFVACSSFQSEARKRNTLLISQAVQVFNKNPQDSKQVFTVLSKLKKESSGFYEYSVQGYEESDTQVVVKVTAAQLKEYFSSYNREVAKINNECLKTNVPDSSLSFQYGQFESCYKRKIEELENHRSLVVKAEELFGIHTVSVTPVGVTSSDCEGSRVNSRDIVAEHLKCFVKKQEAIYSQKVAFENKKDAEDAKRDTEESEINAKREQEVVEEEARKIQICDVDSKIQSINEELAREKEVSKKTGFVSVGRIQYLTREKIKYQQMSVELMKAFQGRVIASKSCQGILGF